jgi:hypothetical protein
MRGLRARSLVSSPWLVAGVILALASIATVYAWPTLLRHLLITEVALATHRPVTIEAVHFNPFTGRLVVRRASLHERDGAAPLADFDLLEVRVRPFALLRGHVWIREIRLEGSTVRVVRHPDGFNISDLIEGLGAGRRSLDVTVDHLVVTRGTAMLEDRALAEPRTWTSEHIEIEAHDLSTRRNDGRAVGRSVTVGSPVSLEMRQMRLRPIHFEAVVTTSNLDLSLARLYLPTDAALLLERGRASSTLEVTLDAREGLRANVNGEIADVALRKPGEPDPVILVPRLTLALADLRHRDDALEVSRVELAGEAKVKDPTARGGDPFRPSSVQASLADVTWPIVRPGRLEVRGSVPGGGQLSLSGRLSPPPAASQLRLQLARVDLSPWAPLVPGPLRVEGLAEADLRIDAPLAPAVPSDLQGSIAVNQLGVTDGRSEPIRARRVEARGIEVHWPSRLAARQLVITAPRATFERDRAGNVLIPGMPERATAPSSTATPALGGAPPDMAVGEILVREGSVGWRDHAVEPPVSLDFADLAARVGGVGWPLRGPLEIRAGGRPPEGGRLEFDGRVGIEPLTAQGRVRAQGAAVAPYLPYAALPARIGGRVDFDLAVALPPGPERRATARGQATASTIDVRDGERTLLRVERAAMSGIDVDWPRRVAIRDVTVQRPWILLERDQSGDLSVRSLLTPRGSRGPANGSDKGEGAAVPITVNTLVVEDGGTRTVDQRVTPPFALDTQRLQGRVHGLSTDPAAGAARVDLAARVGPDSDLTVRGSIGSLSGPLRVDLEGELREFAVPRTNPYLLQHTAWEARSGWLTTTMRCRIDGQALDAKTDILLRRLELARAQGGDEAQARIGLPLGLIVALMKDRRGDIHLSLPVGGRLNDPRFDVSDALWTTVRNVAVKTITAPVSWIGRVHVGADSKVQRVDVNPVPFAPGSAALGPEAQERVLRMTAFLDQVPDVRLVLTPEVSAQDRTALADKDGKTNEKKLAALATQRLEAVRDGITKAGADGRRLRMAAALDGAAEPQVKVDLLEPEAPGRPGLLRRLLGGAEPATPSR